MSETPGENATTDRSGENPDTQQPTTAVVRNDYATAGVALALVALICDFFAARLGIGFGAAALVFALVGLRKAVRTDVGLTQSLTALGLGFLALVLGAIVLGGQNGGQYAGLPPSTVQVVSIN